MAKILIADDEAAVLQFCEFALKKTTHQVISSDNGTRTLEILRENTPDLLVLDVMLPGVDGYSIQLQMSQDENFCHIPVIIISGLGETEHLKKAYDLKADHYLVKPVRLPDVIKAIHLMVSLTPFRNE